MNSEQLLRSLYDAAVVAALPDGKFAGRLPEKPKGRTIVIGAGKAAARMAAAFEDAWDGLCEGLVVTRYGHAVPCRRIEVMEAAHPVPDENGIRAARRILALAQSAGADDLVICLISGGASSLLVMPIPGITLDDKRRINSALLERGVPIDEMNTVRKALSAIKGGQLAAAAAPARIVTYLISDVPGDHPASIGSGPTIASPGGGKRCLEILARYGITLAPHVEAAMQARTEPAKNSGAEVHMLATPLMALEAAAGRAAQLGLTPIILGDALEGEAREVGTVMAGIALSVAGNGLPVKAPAVLLSGGETTVTIRGKGRGGRNSEFLLGLLIALGGAASVSALACDTDGIDGAGDNAGAWFDSGLAARQSAAGHSPERYLDDNDAYAFFAEGQSLIKTGPTFTNVNDFRAVVVTGQVT